MKSKVKVDINNYCRACKINSSSISFSFTRYLFSNRNTCDTKSTKATVVFEFRSFPHFDIVSKYNVGWKTLLLQGLSEPEFYGDLVYKFRKIIGKNDFPYHFKKIIVRYKKIGYNIGVL